MVGVIVAHGINNKLHQDEIKKLLKHAQDDLIAKMKAEELSEHPHIAAWRAAYKVFGATPKKHLSSVENLAQNALKGKEFAPISPLVDLYNAVSLKYLLPAGGEDLDTIVGDIRLTIAGPSESPVILLGQQEARAPEAGEVMYADAEGAICRRWNWKEVERTKLTEKTKNAILVLEALPPVKRSILEAATHELANLIAKQCGGTVTVDILDQKHKTVQLKDHNNYLSLLPRMDALLVDSAVFEAVHNAIASKKEEIASSVHVGQEHEMRVEKVKKLREMGIEPWPAAKEVNATSQEVIAEFSDEKESREYVLAGRVVAKREHGKTSFATIQDRAGKIQLYIRQDEIGKDAYSLFQHYIDLGDIIWCKGTSFRTKMGEITLKVAEFTLLSKCLHPLPEKFHGLTDIETKYRQRYLDLISNEESRAKFIARSEIIRGIRTFLNDHNFLEVETPMLHPIAGGAAARPFITHHNALDSNFYLRIAPELYLKRLVVGGFDRVYEINRNFRNEGVSTRHNPEFTMLEFYMAHQDYHYIMGFVEELLRSVVRAGSNKLQVPYGQHTIDFEKPFERISVTDAVLKYTDLTEKDISPANIDAVIKKHAVPVAHTKATHSEKVYAIFEELVESKLIQPTFVIDYPIEVSPLSKRDSKNPAIAARFELFIGGMEISNGFNELNEPFDQADRFKQQLEAHAAGDEEAHQYDADFVLALEHALPPTVGVGIGIDRLTMLITNTTSIKDVILFPTLKKKE